MGDDEWEEQEEEELEAQLFAQQGEVTLEKAAEENILLQQELDRLKVRTSSCCRSSTGSR